MNWQHNGTSRSLSLAFTPTFICFILLFLSFIFNLNLFSFPSFLFYVLPLLHSFSFHSFFCFSLFFLPFFTFLLFNFRSSFLLSYLYVAPSLSLYTSYPPGQLFSNIQDNNSTPNTVLRAPLCGSSKPSPRSGQSQIQADYSLHLVLGPILCGTLSPMIPARLHDTAVNPTRNFVTCLSPLCFTLRRCQQSRVYSGRL